MYHKKANEIIRVISYYNQQKEYINETKKLREEFILWLQANNSVQHTSVEDFSFPDTYLTVSLSNEPFDNDGYITLMVGDEEFYHSTMSEAEVVREIIKGIINS